MPAGKYAVGFLELLVMKDLDNVAIVHADDSFSRDVAIGAKKWAERFGLKVVLFEGFIKGTINLDDIAQRAKAANAEVLIVCGHMDESVNMRLSLKNIGWHPKAYFASVGPATQAFHDNLKDDAEHVFSSSQWEPVANFPGSKEFNDAFVEAYKGQPSYHAAAAYAAGRLLTAAIVKAGSIDREKVRSVLYRMDAMSIVGRFGVDSTGMQTKHFNVIIQWQKGKKEIVWPEELKTAKPLFR